MTTILISTYVEHLETKRRYRTRRRRSDPYGGGVAGWRPGSTMPWLISPLAVIHLIRVRRHTRSEWHARSHAVRTLLGPAAGRAPPRTAKHLPPSSSGTVAAVAAVWWRRRPQNIITLTFITLFSVVVSPTMCHSLLYTGPVCTAAVPPPLHVPQFDRIFSFLYRLFV